MIKVINGGNEQGFQRPKGSSKVINGGAELPFEVINYNGMVESGILVC